MNDPKETKARVIAAVKAALHTPSPRLISFKHLSTLVDEEMGHACYGFEVNGVHLKTGWADKEHYCFMDLHPQTTALDLHDLRLLLWWLEQGDTAVVAPDRKTYHYLG